VIIYDYCVFQLDSGFNDENSILVHHTEKKDW